ncbi:MAG: hypothetical protein ABS920_02990 [Sporosarcina sp.]
MPDLQPDQLDALKRFSVHVGEQSKVFSSVADILSEPGSDKLFEKVKGLSCAPDDTVASSVYMRRYGFFIVAQLHFLSEYDLLWTGDL